MMPNVDGGNCCAGYAESSGDGGDAHDRVWADPQAVDAIKAGATAYLTKPLNPEELLLHVRKTLEDKRLRAELARLRGQLKRAGISKHHRAEPAMQQVFAIIDRARR